ncbi:hypothetical protein [Paraburkholderia caribensis]|uniref:hypothetical protein n=1 Tax=Paraburkholderia caribensis TaxID=75105 RepID=UPI001CC53BF9|nr:hypothetical protein [Paraburkholderia caribensis]
MQLPIGSWVDMPDTPARKLSRNDHFEVDELLPLAIASAPSTELDKLREEFKALADDRADLIDAYAARGEDLAAANARIVELEAQLAELTAQAQGEAHGSDDGGSREQGAPKVEGSRGGANRRTRGSADS